MTDNIRCNVKDCEAGMRLDQFLASMGQIVSRTHAQRLLKSGNVLINGVSVSAPSTKVSQSPLNAACPSSGSPEIIFNACWSCSCLACVWMSVCSMGNYFPGALTLVESLPTPSPPRGVDCWPSFHKWGSLSLPQFQLSSVSKFYGNATAP